MTLNLNEADLKLIIWALSYVREHDTYTEEHVDCLNELIDRLTRIRFQSGQVDASDIIGSW